MKRSVRAASSRDGSDGVDDETGAEEQRSLQFWAQVRVWHRGHLSMIPLGIDTTAQYVPLRETHDAGDTGAGRLLTGQWVWATTRLEIASTSKRGTGTSSVSEGGWAPTICARLRRRAPLSA